MLKKTLAVLVVALGAALATYLALQGVVARAQSESQLLKSVVTSVENNLLGHTSYTTFLIAGKEALSGQMKLLAATVTREEGVTQIVERSLIPGLTARATVAIWHATEYSFGYNLARSV